MPRLILRGLSEFQNQRFNGSAFHFSGGQLTVGDRLVAQFDRTAWQAAGGYFTRIDAEEVRSVRLETESDTFTFAGPGRVFVSGNALWIDDRCIAQYCNDRWIERPTGRTVRAIVFSDSQ